MVELVLSLIHTQHTLVCMCVVLVLRVSLSPALCAAISLWRTTYVLILPCKSQLKTCAPLFLFIVYKWAQQATLSHALPLSAAEVMLTLSLSLSRSLIVVVGRKEAKTPTVNLLLWQTTLSRRRFYASCPVPARETQRERKRERASVWESFGCKDKSKCKLKKLWQPWQVCYVCVLFLYWKLCFCFAAAVYSAHTHTRAYVARYTHTHACTHR